MTKMDLSAHVMAIPVVLYTVGMVPLGSYMEWLRGALEPVTIIQQSTREFLGLQIGFTGR